jgi:hypothetical protein
MGQILNDVEAGKVSDELRQRGIPPGQRLRVVVESIAMEEPRLRPSMPPAVRSTGWPRSPIYIVMPT